MEKLPKNQQPYFRNKWLDSARPNLVIYEIGMIPTTGGTMDFLTGEERTKLRIAIQKGESVKPEIVIALLDQINDLETAVMRLKLQSMFAESLSNDSKKD